MSRHERYDPRLGPLRSPGHRGEIAPAPTPEDADCLAGMASRLLGQGMAAFHRPCLLLLDQGFNLLRSDGDLAHYGLAAITPGEDVRAHLPFLYGRATTEGGRVKPLTIGSRTAEAVLTPMGEGLAVLLTSPPEQLAPPTSPRELSPAQTVEHEELQRTVLRLRRDRQRLKRELADTRAALEAKTHQLADECAGRRDLIASLFHELRTPLTAILGHTALLRDMRRTSGVDEGLQVIESNAGHLLNLVDKLLDQVSLEMGQLILNPVPIKLASFCREMLAMFEPIAAKRGLAFRLHQRGRPPDWIEVDSTRLRQVLINLIGNAIKYTEYGFVALIVSWELGDLEFAVSDTGPGIPPDARERVLKAFHREQGAQGKPGLGLGLAISNQLVSLMGGRLVLTDRPGGGTVFSFTIPAPTIGASVQNFSEQGAGQPVLLVDDSDDIRALYGRLLEGAGFRVALAESEAAAWSSFERRRPKVVVVDLYLRQWEGIGLIGRLREEGFTGAIVAWSASNLREDRERALAAGANAFLVKPVEPSVICATLNDALRRSEKANRALRA